MVEGYLAELAELMPDFDPGRASPPSASDFDWPNGSFLLLMAGSEAIACGALRRLSETTGELRRMWVKPAWRGMGAGRFLLGALEDLGRQMHLVELRLDTNGVLEAALGLYRSAGYGDIAPYNENSFADFWMAKQL